VQYDQHGRVQDYAAVNLQAAGRGGDINQDTGRGTGMRDGKTTLNGAPIRVDTSRGDDAYASFHRTDDVCILSS
jgi:hypothetical protein